MKLSILIPVFNEERFVEKLLDRVCEVDLEALGLSREIIVVDDCSTDATAEIVEEYAKSKEITLLRHSLNQGKGAALRTAMAAATGDLLLIQDADLEYDPAEYGKLLGPILDGRADVVFGSRFAGGEPHRVLYFWHSVSNSILTLLSNMLTDLNLTDMEVCYKLFRKEIADQIEIEENGFGFEPEVTAKVAKLCRSGDCRLFEVGISYSGRTYEEGKKIGWPDGFRALWCILKYNLLK